MIRYRSLLAALSLIPFSALPLLAQAPGVSSLIDSRDGEIYPGWDRTTAGQISARPVLNDNGVVMLSASMAENDWYQVYLETANPGAIHAVSNVTYGDWPLWSQWSYAITNDNTLVWLNDDRGDRVIGATPITPVNSPIFFHETAGDSSLSGRSIGANNTGLITYRVGSSVYIYDTNNVGDPAALRILSTSGIGTVTGSRNVNDSGQVVFGTSNGDLFYHNWTANTTQELTPGGGVVGAIGSVQPSVNNVGQVAFFGLDSDANQGLYLMDLDDPAGTTQLIESLYGYSKQEHSISINDQGQILFIDRESDDDYALKLWTGSEILTLLSTGDEFLDGIVESIDISSYGINNLGEIVFGYSLRDGSSLLSQGIGYYQIPEPSTVLVFLGGAAGLYFARTRRRVTPSLRRSVVPPVVNP